MKFKEWKNPKNGDTYIYINDDAFVKNGLTVWLENKELDVISSDWSVNILVSDLTKEVCPKLLIEKNLEKFKEQVRIWVKNSFGKECTWFNIVGNSMSFKKIQSNS